MIRNYFLILSFFLVSLFDLAYSQAAIASTNECIQTAFTNVPFIWMGNKLFISHLKSLEEITPIVSNCNFEINDKLPVNLNSLKCYNSDPVTIQNFQFKDQYKSEIILKLGLYIEVDYHTYQSNNFDYNTTIDWATELFLQLKTIYLLHNIDLYISEIFIWEQPDNYALSHNPDELLEEYSNQIQNDFNGDVAMLWSTKMLGGGKAIYEGLCKEYDPVAKLGPYAVATSLSLDLRMNQNYSWSIYIVAHELGHVLGSPHTHACQWGLNGNMPLDNCFAPEGDCNVAEPSELAGTVMSYCYLQERGIDFTLGLGSEPGTLIYNKILNSTCFQSECLNLLCDDNNACTMNDRLDDSCNCSGQLIDFNKNNICDLNESCLEEITILEMAGDSMVAIADSTIRLNTDVPQDHSLLLSASNIILLPGISISKSSDLGIYNFGCVDR